VAGSGSDLPANLRPASRDTSTTRNIVAGRRSLDGGTVALPWAKAPGDLRVKSNVFITTTQPQ